MANYENNNGRSLCEINKRRPMSNVGNLLPCNEPRVFVRCKPPMSKIYEDRRYDKENVFFKSQGIGFREKIQLPKSVDEKEDIDEKESPFEECTEMALCNQEGDISSSKPEIYDSSPAPLPDYVAGLYGDNDSPLIWDVSLNNPQDSYDRTRSLYNYEEYSKDVYDYLRKAEMRHRPNPKYMQRQPEINLEMRSTLIDWLVEVALEYSLNNETLYLSVSLIDRLFSKRTALKKRLQLIGTAAMFVAGKYEEAYCPETEDYVYITDNSCSIGQILRAEQVILTELGFNINVPTINCFLQYMCCATDLPENVLFLAQYICELTLLEPQIFLRFLPSQIAGAAIGLAKYTMGFEPWDEKLEITTGYKLQDLREVMECLHLTHRNSRHSPYQAIRNKYKRVVYNGVSSILTPEEFLEKHPSMKYKRKNI